MSGDINLNTMPVNRYQIKDRKFDVFNGKGLHFNNLHLKSLLPKIDELCFIPIRSSAAKIGIPETKLHNSIYDSEVAKDKIYKI